jgi:hypothetical protein
VGTRPGYLWTLISRITRPGAGDQPVRLLSRNFAQLAASGFGGATSGFTRDVGAARPTSQPERGHCAVGGGLDLVGVDLSVVGQQVGKLGAGGPERGGLGQPVLVAGEALDLGAPHRVELTGQCIPCGFGLAELLAVLGRFPVRTLVGGLRRLGVGSRGAVGRLGHNWPFR